MGTRNDEREVRSAKDLGEIRNVSPDEAIAVLRGITRLSETMAHRTLSTSDHTAIVVIGQVDNGPNSLAAQSIIGDIDIIAYMIAKAMDKDPELRTAITKAVSIDRLRKMFR